TTRFRLRRSRSLRARRITITRLRRIRCRSRLESASSTRMTAVRCSTLILATRAAWICSMAPTTISISLQRAVMRTGSNSRWNGSADKISIEWIGKRGRRNAIRVLGVRPYSGRAQDIYDAWLSSSGHENITGGQKAQISAQDGAAFTVWNGYITGRNLKLEPGRRIVQSWRTTKFADTDPDSQIEVLLQPAAGGTGVTGRHSNVPGGHTSYRDGGWQRSYFEPMKQHFKRAQ